ncbi:MAG: hypothetical protein ACXAC7_19525 [Candidatus Hodarchaeales archaeon]
MSFSALTPIEKARKTLLSLEDSEFRKKISSKNTRIESDTIILYYQALAQILRQAHSMQLALTKLERDNLEKNRQILRSIRDKVINEDLSDNLEEYCEAIVFGALTSAIREYEASIEDYEKYQAMIYKFHQWVKIGIKEHRVVIAWNQMNLSVVELQEWFEQKSQKYFPHLDNLVHLIEYKPDLESINYPTLVENLQTHFSDKEIFYLLVNMLQTNPILHRKVNSLSIMKKIGHDKLEHVLLKMLKELETKTKDKSLKRMIQLFFKQSKFEIKKE